VPSQPGDAELPWGWLSSLRYRFAPKAISSNDARRQAILGDNAGGPVNEVHLQRRSSVEWAQAVEELILPWALKAIDLGDDV